jgi:CRP-like cAMP-binding protein
LPMIEQSAVRNRLLAALPAADFAHIREKLRRVDLSVNQILFGPEQPIDAVHFVESGLVSLLAPLEDGSQIEVALVGCEGASGIECVMGAKSSALEALIQLDGTALTLSRPDAQDVFGRNAALRQAMLRFSQAQYCLVAQTAACNGRHQLEQRLARWILMVHDRIKDDHVLMTHEFMAMMLGVRRPGVTMAIGTLKRAGLIRHGNGHVDVIDRTGLEQASCECYEVVRRRYDDLLPH